MRFWKVVQANWERYLFLMCGLACIVFSFRFVWVEKIPAASALFAIGFFCFFYANLARFKRFKGFGFEAELWEDKQKEAADLIDRLKSVVAIYTRETVMAGVMRGRWIDRVDWKDRWALYDELVEQHETLGQKIDFSDLRRDVEGVFIFDICAPLRSSLEASLNTAKLAANGIISAKYGNPITNVNEYSARVKAIEDLKIHDDDLFIQSKHENIAQIMLQRSSAASDVLRREYEISPGYSPSALDGMERVARLAAARPFVITEELIQMADGDAVLD